MIVHPDTRRFDLLLTARQAISHHDPAVTDDSNTMLFNRHKQLLRVDESADVASPDLMARLATTHQVPADVANVMQEMAFPEFVAVTLTRLFLDMYNSQDGCGLFEGMERYSRLESRLRSAAIPAATLRGWWDRLCAAMKVPIHGGKYDVALYDLLSVPVGTQRAVLQVFIDGYRSVVSVARMWHSVAKLESEEYAEKAGVFAAIQPKVVLEFSAQRSSVATVRVVEVPVVSGNSLRHQVVREPAWWHLAAALGLPPATPGLGPIPAGAEALFYNGGNIEAGAKQPTNTHALSWAMRGAYPSLDLLGGVADSFDLGKSRLRVGGYIVCRENREALAGTPAYDLPAASVSIFDMMDDVDGTRQATPIGGKGQMIYGFETLASGVAILVRLSLLPFTPVLTEGALATAVNTYLACDGVVAGQSARGFGQCDGVWLGDAPVGGEEYEEYVVVHHDELADGIRDGTLGTGKVILS